jgi:hydroxypyruvate reductase
MSLKSAFRKLFESTPDGAGEAPPASGTVRTGVEAEMRRHAEAILRASIEAVQPEQLVREALQRHSASIPLNAKIFVAGFGRAADAMARAAEAALSRRITEGVIIVPAGTEVRVPERFDTFAGGDPVPDPAGEAGSRAIRQLAREATADDVLLCLVSPGASSLLTVPTDGIPLEEIRLLTRLLIEAGAPEGEIGLVLRHLDLLKGGRLAREAAPARVVGIVLSRHPGDPLDRIASGVLAPERTRPIDAVKTLKRYGVWKQVPLAVRGHLDRGICGELEPPPAARDACFEKVELHVVGNGPAAARAACETAEELGYETQLLTGELGGEARRAGSFLASTAQTLARRREEGRPPLCLITVGQIEPPSRRGPVAGPNQELVLATALEVASIEPVLVAAMATSGLDGATESAGAIATGSTLRRAADAGLDCHRAVRRGEVHQVLSVLDDLIVSGPTGTDVGDLQVLLIS